MGAVAKEVKQEILGKVKSGMPVKDVSAQYGISDRSIYLWLKTGVSQGVSVLEHNKLKKENQLLKEIVGCLTIQLQELKKKRR